MFCSISNTFFQIFNPCVAAKEYYVMSVNYLYFTRTTTIIFSLHNMKISKLRERYNNKFFTFFIDIYIHKLSRF